MDLHFAVATVFTALFFAGATARISFTPSHADLPLLPNAVESSNAIVKSLPEPQSAAVAGDSNIVLPSQISKSDSDVTESESETEKSRMFGVDLTPRTDFARFHAINRHFFDEPRVPVRSVHRRPYRHFVNPFAMPRSEIGDEVKFSGEIGNFDLEAFHRRAPAKRMKVRHDYGHQNHHRNHHPHHHHHLHHGNNDGSVSKHVSDREKVKSSLFQHKEKKNREHEASFMKRFRKFLKHTFD